MEIPSEYVGESKQLTIDEAKKLKRVSGEKAKEFEEKVLAKQDGQFKDLYVIVFGWKEQGEGKPKKLMSKLPSGKLCHHGDTLILMEDMTWKQIRDIEVGDKVVGFDLVKKDQKTCPYYSVSEVTHKAHRFAHTVKIKTAIGETICTPDHKWMTNHLRYIETKDFKPSQAKVDTMLRLISTPYEHGKSREYMRGWLAGVFDGDGSIEKYEYQRKKRGNKIYYRTSLGSTDIEIIDRADEYIQSIFKKKFNRALRKKAKDTHKNFTMLKDYSEEAYNQMRYLAYDFDVSMVTDEFARGYLGGVFDAEGSYDGYHISIASNEDLQVRQRLLYFLKKFGFNAKFVKVGNAHVTRILGGKPDFIRFFALTHPVLERKKFSKFVGQRQDNSVKIESIEEMKDVYGGLTEVFSITTTTHNYVADGYISKNCFPDKTENVSTIEQGLPYICLVYDRKTDEEGKPGREAFAKIICEEYTPKIYVPSSRLPHMVWRDKSGTLRNKAPFGNTFEDRIISAIKEMEKMGFPSVKVVFRLNEKER